MKNEIEYITPTDIKPYKAINVKIPLHLYKAMKKIAKRTRKHIGVVYQEAIECYLDQPEQYGWDSE